MQTTKSDTKRTKTITRKSGVKTMSGKLKTVEFPKRGTGRRSNVELAIIADKNLDNDEKSSLITRYFGYLN